MATRKATPEVSNLVNATLSYEDPNSLTLWKDNPRKNDQAVEKLAIQLAIQGQRAPIVVWRQNKVVYKGNTTLKALRHLCAMTTHQYAEFVKPYHSPIRPAATQPKTVLVMWVDFPSLGAAVAFGIADNKSNEWTEWDEDKLDDLMKELKDNFHDVNSIGILSALTAFTPEEIANLSLVPDFDKLNKTGEQADGLSGVIKIVCRAEDRDEVLEWLKEELVNLKITGVEVK